jgi:hypothetical protein
MLGEAGSPCAGAAASERAAAQAAGGEGAKA